MNYLNICKQYNVENLRDADLRGADLRHANLRHANLRGADLRDAGLHCADLRGAGLVVIYGEVYFISICRGTVRAGCQSYTVEEWRSFSKHKVVSMDGRNSLNYYPRLLDIIDFYCGKGSRPEWLAKK